MLWPLPIDYFPTTKLLKAVKTLKVADAKQFVEAPHEFELWEFETVDADAAAIMATAEVDDLNLSGATRLSVDAARALAQFPGVIRLNSLIEMPADVLREFKHHSGGMWLSFEHADKKLMEALPEKGMIDFTRLEKLSGEAASALKGREGDLTFGGINDLDAEAAGYLATIAGDLDLSYLRAADAEVLKAFAPHQGTLKLGLVYLSREQATALSLHQGPVCLNDLRLVMPEVAEELAKHSSGLMLSGAVAPGRAVELLREHPFYDEDWICNEVLDEYSASLVDDSGNGPDFYHIRLLGAGAVRQLVEKKKNDEYPTIALGNVLAISDDDAEALKSFRGMLELGVYGLTDIAAASLAKHRGSLHLGYLAEISDTGAKALSKHKDLYVNDAYLPVRLHKIITNSADPEYGAENVPREESATEKASNDLHFTLGRLRARLGGPGAAMMGGFDTLLDDLQQAVRDGADLRFLKTERLLIEFLEACQSGESTEELRKKLEDFYWED